jgi:hypothetical protein
VIGARGHGEKKLLCLPTCPKYALVRPPMVLGTFASSV